MIVIIFLARAMMTVNDFDRVTCRLAIQMCVGYFPDGRERHRTFSIKNIDPNAEISALNALVRAIAPLLAYPITKVRLVTKKIRVLFDAGADNAPSPVTATESRVVDLTGPEEPARPAEPAKLAPESRPTLFPSFACDPRFATRKRLHLVMAAICAVEKIMKLCLLCRLLRHQFF
jgi:hypothetical protein